MEKQKYPQGKYPQEIKDIEHAMRKDFSHRSPNSPAVSPPARADHPHQSQHGNKTPINARGSPVTNGLTNQHLETSSTRNSELQKSMDEPTQKQPTLQINTAESFRILDALIADPPQELDGKLAQPDNVAKHLVQVTKESIRRAENLENQVNALHQTQTTMAITMRTNQTSLEQKFDKLTAETAAGAKFQQQQQQELSENPKQKRRKQLFSLKNSDLTHMPLQLYNKIQRIPSKNGANSFSVSKTPT